MNQYNLKKFKVEDFCNLNELEIKYLKELLEQKIDLVNNAPTEIIRERSLGLVNGFALAIAVIGISVDF